MAALAVEHYEFPLVSGVTRKMNLASVSLEPPVAVEAQPEMATGQSCMASCRVTCANSWQTHSVRRAKTIAGRNLPAEVL
jgi:hypothetical protein